MIVKHLLAALVAGLIAGVLMTAMQQYRVVPLILHAEEFEGEEAPADPGHQHSSKANYSTFGQLASSLYIVTPAYAHDHPAAEGEEEGGIMFGMSRFSGTLAANLVAGAGFALLLAGVSLVSGHTITVANGVLWGGCAWLAVHFLPALGLPPELPGFPAADLGERQVWWLITVALSAIGLYLLAIRGEIAAKIVGILLIAAPHFWGAPQPDSIDSAVPAVLAAEFAVAALATTLFFWVVLGLALGYLNDKVVKAA
ncbi:CbtA family protein [Rhizobiaceae bacterium n13]|uniref:CbtA family protein n=1 Tax=Ferirhizobium litorale TaxID=2927786 RepID=A0AAE3U4Z1_9HYPH|nr:CbtA family protein [Fererhizobium litorale]MDI7863590.1 CbtA family protein [Fererhizobium litorale]MDI7923489.1 CbtA family protein [Fererhizobium litorale]